MKQVTNIRRLVLTGLAYTALLAPAGGAMAQVNCQANGPAEIVITDPAVGADGIVDTENSTIDIKGVIVNPCALSGVAAENQTNGEVRDANKVTTNFADEVDKWFFTINGLPLEPAPAPGESLTNQIKVSAAGANSPGPLMISVTQTQPGGGGIPSDGILNPVNAAVTKAKVTWNHVNSNLDAVSTVAILQPLEPFELPCASDHEVIVTLYAETASGAVALFSQNISRDMVGTCNTKKYRMTGPRGGIRELLLTPRSNGEVGFYVFGESLEYGPSTDASVRDILQYTLALHVVYPDRTLEWQIGLGTERPLFFETAFNGKGEPVRTVVRYNR